MNLRFSGLKTAVRYRIAGIGKADWGAMSAFLSSEERADIAASVFQTSGDRLFSR